MQTKRMTFTSRWLPYLLLAPQVTITLIFFVWPASQALWQSMLRQDPFGLRVTFIWFRNFERLFADPHYLGALKTTLLFSISTALLGFDDDHERETTGICHGGFDLIPRGGQLDICELDRLRPTTLLRA